MNDLSEVPELTPEGKAGVIDGLATQIGEWSQAKGFREDWEMADRLECIGTTILGNEPVFVEDNVELRKILNEAAQIIRNNVVGTKLMLMVSELAEALETLRDHGAQSIIEGRGEDNFMEELADAEIRIKDAAHMVGQSLGQAEMAKVEKNRDRPYKHGRKM